MNNCEIAWKKFCENNSIINENDTSIIRSVFEYAFKEGCKQKDFKVGDVIRIKFDAKKYHQNYQNGYYWLSDRDKYLGKLTVITNIATDGSIKLKISDCDGMYWSAIDLEHYNK